MFKHSQEEQLTHIKVKSDKIDKPFADEFYKIYGQLEKENSNIVFDLKKLERVSEDDVHWITCMANDVKDQGKSFVICSFKGELPIALQELEYTPTFNEAKDIIYMDELERSLDQE